LRFFSQPYCNRLNSHQRVCLQFLHLHSSSTPPASAAAAPQQFKKTCNKKSKKYKQYDKIIYCMMKKK
jgi:hypothetical protein